MLLKAKWSWTDKYTIFGEGHVPYNSEYDLYPNVFVHDTLDHMFLRFPVGGVAAELKAFGAFSWRSVHSYDFHADIEQVINDYDAQIGWQPKKMSAFDEIDISDLAHGGRPDIYEFIRDYGQQFFDAGYQKAEKIYKDRNLVQHFAFSIKEMKFPKGDNFVIVANTETGDIRYDYF